MIGHKGQNVFTGFDDEEAVARGIFRAYQERNLRYSQLAPLDMYQEKNTGTNLPAQVELYADPCDEYHFLFMAKGGGSANKSFLYQETKALLNPESLTQFVAEKIRTLGTSACPPYHLALVIGGNVGRVHHEDRQARERALPRRASHQRNELGRAFRDLALEEQVLKLCNETGIGAQFGGKYFAHDVRVIRLPRHGASCPVGIGVSCSADRQVLGKITRGGIFLEQLETNPAQYLPDVTSDELGGDVVRVDLTRPWTRSGPSLRVTPVATRLSLSGPLVVARDIAHAKLKERLDAGQDLPQYMKDHAVYYAGPAKRPGRTRVGLVRSDHRRPHGFLRRPVSESRRQHGHAGQGKPLGSGPRGV